MWLCLLDYSKMVTLENILNEFTFVDDRIQASIVVRKPLWLIVLVLRSGSMFLYAEVNFLCTPREKIKPPKKKTPNNWIAGYSNAKKDVNLAALSEPNGNHQGWIEVGNNSRKFCLSAMSPTSETRPQLQHPRSTTSCRALM